MDELIKIIEFIAESFLHIWPYLLVTIPLAVIINISGASKYITKAFTRNPLSAVLLATIVGAFSPFCSCGVIPVISSLLIGGVPLAPVMSFWIASPSMDPEIFFLSSSILGWKLAVWRLASTFIISLLAGYITHFLMIKGYIDKDVIRSPKKESTLNSGKESTECGCSACDGGKSSCSENPRLTAGRLLKEILKATIMVAKFMGLAFLITALLNFYVPEDLISGIANVRSNFQVILATLTGIPLYTSNLTALPIAGGLMKLGLNEGAALAFLIAGATTTLPAMVAVWGITKRRIFILYLSFVMAGALTAGFIYNLIY